MCQICDDHGDGGKWYLNPKNYPYKIEDDLDLERFGLDWVMNWGNWQEVKELAEKCGGLKHHQVVPLEDALHIIDLTNEIHNNAYGYFSIGVCPCTENMTGEKVAKCMGFGFFREATRTYLAARQSAPFVPVEEFKAKMVELDRKGFVHTLDGWGLDFGHSYVSHICNCTMSACTKLRMRDVWGLPYCGKGEYVAEVNPLQCSGCRRCASYCQFGAIRFDPASRKAYIDLRLCQGCGVCRAQCEPDAIRLQERRGVPAVANLW